MQFFNTKALAFTWKMTGMDKKVNSFFSDKLKSRSFWTIVILMAVSIFGWFSANHYGTQSLGEKKLYDCKVLRGFRPVTAEGNFVLVLQTPDKRIFDLEVTPSAFYQGTTLKHIRFELHESQIGPNDKLSTAGNLAVFWAIVAFVSTVWLVLLALIKLSDAL